MDRPVHVTVPFAVVPLNPVASPQDSALLRFEFVERNTSTFSSFAASDAEYPTVTDVPLIRDGVIEADDDGNTESRTTESSADPGTASVLPATSVARV